MVVVGRCFRRPARLATSRRPGVAPAAALALLLLALAGAGPAGASRQWCRTDPVVAVDGAVADVFVSGPLEAPLLVTGPTLVVVPVPAGVDARLVASDLGFGRGVAVSFAEARWLKARDGRAEVQVEVLVPASDAAMPVLVEVAPRVVGVLRPASAEGVANRWVTVRTAV